MSGRRIIAASTKAHSGTFREDHEYESGSRGNSRPRSTGKPASPGREYRIIALDSAATCQSGTRTEGTIEGPDDVEIARADGFTVNAAICPGAGSVLQVQWTASSAWKNSGNLSGGCAEIQAAGAIKVRAVSTNFHETATYSACLQQ